MTTTTKTLVIAALALSGVGVLLICEVIRPFRDLAVDGPLALLSWVVGATCGGVCFFRKGRSVTLSVIAVGANLIPLIAALALMWVMSRSNFAWH